MSFSHSHGQRRSYTLEDLAMLRRIRDLSREGVPLAKISEALTVEAVRAEGPTKALINMSDVAQALEMARDAYASIELKNAELQERVSALEEYIQTPWWRRKKAPKKASD
jgi:DNA-binding transcriptional MerR regulator